MKLGVMLKVVIIEKLYNNLEFILVPVIAAVLVRI